MVDTSYNRQLLAQFDHYQLSQGQEGYSIKVTDTSTMEVVAGCTCVPSLAGVGLQPYYGIVTNWKRIVEKHGSNINLDLSRTPELTVSAVKDGAFASEYIIIVYENNRRYGYQVVEVKNKYSNLPLFSIVQEKNIFHDDNDDRAFAKGWMESIRRRFDGTFSLDISKAPTLGKYFKELI